MPSTIICTIIFILCGCVSNGDNLKHSKLVSDFYHTYISPSERIKQFKNYSLDEQYELFLFGNQVVHPPATYLATPFAKQGPVIVPFLKTKLESAQKEVTIRDIVAVLSELARLKLYDFSKDHDLMDLLERRAKEMDGIWKDTTLKMIYEIRSTEKGVSP